jgi:hypothetical protein
MTTMSAVPRATGAGDGMTVRQAVFEILRALGMTGPRLIEVSVAGAAAQGGGSLW